MCDEVWDFQQFIQEFSKGGSLGKATQKEITQSTFVMCFGGAMSYDMPVVTHSINNAMKQNKGAILAYFHTMEDCVAKEFVKPANLIEAYYKPDSEEAFALLLASVCIAKENMPFALKNQIKKYERKITKEIPKEVKSIVEIPQIDENGNEVLIKKEEIKQVLEQVEELSSELIEYCVKDSTLELENLKRTISISKNPILVVGFDIYRAKNAKNIARILACIEMYSEVKILLLPPTTNALGISLLCDLEQASKGYSIGYNAKGDFTIGVEDNNVLIMPYLREQEGTFVNVDKRVVPISPAIPYKGYELNDIAKEIGLQLENTIDYTLELPLQKGFKSVEYDNLGYGFLNDGTEIRGYLLEPLLMQEEVEVEGVELEELKAYNLYARNAMAHFSKETLNSQYLDSKNGLQMSEKLAKKLGLESGDYVEIDFGDSKVLQREVTIDNEMEGDIAALGVCGLEEFEYFPNSRYQKVQLKAIK